MENTENNNFTHTNKILDFFEGSWSIRDFIDQLNELQEQGYDMLYFNPELKTVEALKFNWPIHKSCIKFKTQQGQFAFIDYLQLSEEKDNDYTLFMGFVDNFTEKDWLNVVDGFGMNKYKNYLAPAYSEYLFNSATESGESLLKHLKIELSDDKEWVLLKYA